MRPTPQDGFFAGRPGRYPSTGGIAVRRVNGAAVVRGKSGHRGVVRMFAPSGRLVLVRHAMPVVQPDVPAEQWELDERGRAAARALSIVVTGSAYLVASDEPKALQTLQKMAAGREVVPETAFREVRRLDRWSDGYVERARAYVSGIRQEGWEPRDRVAARFGAAVRRHAEIAAARQQPLVVGTHGLAPTVWLATVVALEPTPADFWASLTFPDVIDVDLAAGRVERRVLPSDREAVTGTDPSSD